MKKLKERCPNCNGRVVLKRSWTKAFFYCKDCKTKFDKDKMKYFLNDYTEEFLAFLPVDRL